MVTQQTRWEEAAGHSDLPVPHPHGGPTLHDVLRRGSLMCGRSLLGEGAWSAWAPFRTCHEPWGHCPLPRGS